MDGQTNASNNIQQIVNWQVLSFQFYNYKNMYIYKRTTIISFGFKLTS
jgi:hypothetical protein